MRAAAERGAKLTDQLLSFSRRQRLEPKVARSQRAPSPHARPAAKHDGRQHPDRDRLCDLACGLRWSIRPSSNWRSSTSRSTPAMRWRSAAALTCRHRERNARGTARPEEPPAGEYVAMSRHRYRHRHDADESGARCSSRSSPPRRSAKAPGLGLSQVLGLCQAVRRRRANRVPSSGEGRRCIFICRAPSRGVDRAARSFRKENSRVERTSANILLVDDDSAVRDRHRRDAARTRISGAGGGQRRGGARPARSRNGQDRSGDGRFRHAGHERRRRGARGAGEAARACRCST